MKKIETNYTISFSAEELTALQDALRVAAKLAAGYKQWAEGLKTSVEFEGIAHDLAYTLDEEATYSTLFCDVCNVLKEGR